MNLKAAVHSQHTIFQVYIIPVWQTETACCLKAISASTCHLPSIIPIEPFYFKSYINYRLYTFQCFKGQLRLLHRVSGKQYGYVLLQAIIFIIAVYTSVQTYPFPILGKSILRNGNIHFPKWQMVQLSLLWITIPYDINNLIPVHMFY